MKNYDFEKLNEFYAGDVPAYVLEAGKNHLKINVENWDGTHKVKITLKDVLKYYLTQAQNLSSGLRTLAGYSSDWRGVDQLASECLEWFKFVNPETLRDEANKFGLEPKF